MNDIALLDATAQTELVCNKQVKPIELLEAAIERIERINPQINAVVTPSTTSCARRREARSPMGALAACRS
jgi:amidase